MNRLDATRLFGRWLAIILIVSFVLRLYKVTSPVADWHSFRQADTASVTREYVKHGVDFLRPKYHDLSNIQSGENNGGKDNVEGWRMVEFPLINGILAYLLRVLPFLDLVIVSRLASIAASLCSLFLLARIVHVIYGECVALLTGLFFGIMPYSIYYSRVILPEPFFIALSLASLASYMQFLEKGTWKWIVTAALFFGLALLVKPMAIFFIPVFVGIRFWKKIDVRPKDIGVAILFLISCIPLYLWRKWIQQYSIGIPISAWLYNGVGKGTNLLPVYKIRFRPAWWRWIFYERLTKLFLGYVGMLFFGLGFVQVFSKRKEKLGRLLFFLSWVVGALLYVVVFAAGNVQHDYYQIPLVPFVSLAAGLGISFLFVHIRRISSVAVALSTCFVLIMLSLFFSWKIVGGYYHINNWDIVTAGRAADKLLPSDAKVIAPYNGNTAFLFQTNRTGWPIGFDIQKKIREGARYYVSVNYDDETNALMKKYQVVEQKKEYVIIDLKREMK